MMRHVTMVAVMLSGCVPQETPPLLSTPIGLGPADLVTDYKREVAVYISPGSLVADVVADAMARLSVVDAMGQPVSISLTEARPRQVSNGVTTPGEAIFSLPALDGWYEIRLDVDSRRPNNRDQFLHSPDERIMRSRVKQQSDPIVRRVVHKEEVGGRSFVEALLSEPVRLVEDAAGLSGLFVEDGRRESCEMTVLPRPDWVVQVSYLCPALPPDARLRLAPDTFVARQGARGVRALDGSVFDRVIPGVGPSYSAPY
jgi:hypothetical protein